MDLKSLFRYFITKEKLAFSLYLLWVASYFPQHILYFLPLPHGSSHWGFRQHFVAFDVTFWLPAALYSTRSPI